MTTFIVDDESARTPIGDFLQAARDSCIEIRTADGELVATLIVSPADVEEETRYQTLFHLVERERETIERRLKTPVSDCLTTPEFLQRLKDIDPN